jgi:predicted RNase H-like HicB family nuclease
VVIDVDSRWYFERELPLEENTRSTKIWRKKELVFEVSQDEDGTWVAAGIGDDIFTQGANLDELKANISEAIRVHFAGEYYHDFKVRLDKVLSRFTVAA